MTLQAIKADSSGHFLVTADNKPFFLLGDTAWELLHKLSVQDAAHYLDTRKSQGFNTVFTVALAEMDGLRTPNALGRVPLCGDDPARPNEFYFRDVDNVIDMAAERELYIALLPTWGDKVNSQLWGTGPAIFTEENARIYGEFLGKRYCDKPNVLWVLGGDRPAAGFEAIWNAMADGILSAYEGKTKPFITYHPMGRCSTSTELHKSRWLDMNMLQSGHMHVDYPNDEMIAHDYALNPAKPVLDGEPCYEHHPIDAFSRKWQPEFGRYDDYDIRRAAYRSVFAGACGHVYGNHSIWQFVTDSASARHDAIAPWKEAILHKGASQMQHLKTLIESRPYFDRVPDDGELIQYKPENKIPMQGNMEIRNKERACRPAASRSRDFTYAFLYFPQSKQTLDIDLSKFKSQTIKAQWYDPRSGEYHNAGQLKNEKVKITSPLGGPDWVLVLDEM